MPSVWGIRPAKSAARAGVHSGKGVYALAKRVPRAARASRLGVRTSGWGADPTGRAKGSPAQLSAAACCWSVITRSTLGRSAITSPNHVMMPVDDEHQHHTAPRARLREQHQVSSTTTQDLAIDGGAPLRTRPFPTINDARGRQIGEEELALLTEVIRSGQLNRNNGTKVAALERAWAETFDAPRAVASTSGTAAIHVALGALPLNPGDEVITTPITDWGTVGPILAQ